MQKEMIDSYRGKKAKGKVLSPPLDIIPRHSETNFALERTLCYYCIYMYMPFILVTFHRSLPVGINTPLWGFSISTSYKKAITMVLITT